MSKKKLLLYSIYYWPEVASTAQIYAELCESLVDAFDITVICAVPCYSGTIEDRYKTQDVFYEEHNGVKIVRVRVPEYDKRNKIDRVKNIVAFYLNASKAARKLGPQDIVFTYSQPPVLGGMLGVRGKKLTGGKLVYGIQDFNPEQTMAVNYMGGSLVHKVMMWMDKRSCRKSDLVITVGRDMQETLEKRFSGEGAVPNNIVINNWADDEGVHPLPKTDPKVAEFRKRYGLTGKFTVMYSGNIGLFYDLQNIIKVIGKYKDREDIAFAFVGDGAVKAELEEYCKENAVTNVVFIPYQDKSDLIYSLNAADVHLVCNARGIKGVSVPSKIYGIMATGVPIFGILEEGSEAWRIIQDSGCGVCAHAGEYYDIEKHLDEILNQTDKFVDTHATGRAYLELHFSRKLSLDKYDVALKELIDD